MVKEEARIQAWCVFWLRNKYPETHGLFFTINNNATSIRGGVNNKAMGVVAGVSDCVFFWGGKLYCIEFKTFKGRQSPDQKKWQENITKQGAEYHIVRCLEDFKELINKIINT